MILFFPKFGPKFSLILSFSSIYLSLNVILDIRFRPLCSTLIKTTNNLKYQLLLFRNSCTLHTRSAVVDVPRCCLSHRMLCADGNIWYDLLSHSRKTGNSICFGLSFTNINSHISQIVSDFMQSGAPESS